MPAGKNNTRRVRAVMGKCSTVGCEQQIPEAKVNTDPLAPAPVEFCVLCIEDFEKAKAEITAEIKASMRDPNYGLRTDAEQASRAQHPRRRLKSRNGDAKSPHTINMQEFRQHKLGFDNGRVIKKRIG